MSAAYRVGDEVTVQPVAEDSIILHLSRYVIVSRVTEEGYWVRQHPVGRELGPIPASRLLPGWRVGGQWR